MLTKTKSTTTSDSSTNPQTTRNTKSSESKLKAYEDHGLDFRINGLVGEADCPFCEDDKHHFHVKQETGQFRCVRCEVTGNIYTFLQMFHELATKHTTDEQYFSLAQERGIPIHILKFGEMALNPLTQEWMVPGYNLKGNLSNLYRCTLMGNKVRALSTTGCKLTPFGTKHITASQRQLKVVEGLWDYLLMTYLLQSVKQKGETYIRTTDVSQSLYTTVGVFGAPGSGTFSPEWSIYFDDREADILFDNDHPKLDEQGIPLTVKGKTVRPGYNGQLRTAGILEHSANKIRQMAWGKEGHNPSLPNGFDVGDIIHLTAASQMGYTLPEGATRLTPSEPTTVQLPLNTVLSKWADKDWDTTTLYHQLLSNGSSKSVDATTLTLPVAYRILNGDWDKGCCRLLDISTSPKEKTKGPVANIELIPRDSFATLRSDFRSNLHFSSNLEDTLVVSLAVILSTELEGDQLWFRFIGPPGSGKSTLAECLSAARDYVIPKSVMTGLHSGYIGDRKERKKGDSSLIPQFNNKTVIVKDADTLMNSPSRDTILRELRDIYDGVSRSAYRNRKSEEYTDLKITFILCGTDHLRGLNRTFLGERFLDCDIFTDDDSSDPLLSNAMQSTLTKLRQSHGDIQKPEREAPKRDTFLKGVTLGYIHYLKENLHGFPFPEFTVEVEDRIKAMAKFISYMRARIQRVEGGDISYRPRAEIATRLTAQLTKLAVCVAWTLNRTTVDEEVMRIISKVAKDTCQGFPFETTCCLLQKHRNLKELMRALNMPETSIRRILSDMLEFGMVRRVALKNNSGQRGRDLHSWKLSDELIELWNVAKIDG